MFLQQLKNGISTVLDTTSQQFKKVSAPVILGVTLLSGGLCASVPSFAQGTSDSSSQASTEIVPVSPPEGAASFGKSAKCSPLKRVTSQPMPLPGQTHRSSGNFDLSGIRVGQVFKVNVRNGVSFNLKRDIRRAIDPTLVSGMRAGYYKRVSKYPLYPLYIADPRGAGKNAFTVTFCGR
jgi:hypothetical protein